MSVIDLVNLLVSHNSSLHLLRQSFQIWMGLLFIVLSVLLSSMQCMGLALPVARYDLRHSARDLVARQTTGMLLLERVTGYLVGFCKRCKQVLTCNLDLASMIRV